jgi:hypothetical protein
MDQNELPLEPCHLGEPSSLSKWFQGLAKTVQLSYTNPNTVSKRTKTWIDMTRIT